MNYRDYLQKVIYHVIDPSIRLMIRIGITPNIITFTGFLGNVAAAVLFVCGAAAAGADSNSQTMYSCLLWGGIVILAAGLFDMIDGRLARTGNMQSRFGALFDSTLDRYSELLTLAGIAFVFISADIDRWFWYAVATFAAMVGSVMVSYVRARAEGLGIECKVGLMPRPERVVVTAVVTILSGATGSLWFTAGGMLLIAVLANITAFWRVGYCYSVLKKDNK